MSDETTIDPLAVDLTLRGLTIVRHYLTPIVLRDAAEDDATDGDGNDSLGLMDVRFSKFDTWYEVNSWWEGHFLERTQRGAFKRTINEHNDASNPHQMKTLFNHGGDFHIGDKLLGDITKSREDRDSPVNTVNLWDTSYNRDLLPGLKRGAYGSSFMFTVTREAWNREPGASDHNPDGLPERTIQETRTFEAGPVTWPANPDATAQMNSARPGSITSGTDAYYESLSRMQGDTVARMRDHVIALRSAGRLASTPLAGVAATTDDETGPHEVPEGPALRRSTGLTPAERRRRIFLMKG